MRTLTIPKPDDWHVHLRDGKALIDTVNASAKHFSRALLMPNLKPALTTIPAIIDYRNRVLNALHPETQFNPYFTFYLNESVSAEELNRAKNIAFILGAKLYPSGATTNSEQGARSIQSLYPLFEVLQSNDRVLQIHGETNEGDIFDREANFIENHLKSILKNFPKLRVVFEHISTKAAVEFVMASSDYLAATITPHHLYYNRNQLLAGGIKPHYYCLPILKRQSDQQALIEAATSGNPKFFAGTDSAPHALEDKESACGCAGIYSAPYALALYADVFANRLSLDNLANFLCYNGAQFYQLPVNTDQIEIANKPQLVPNFLPYAESKVIPIAAGSTLAWSVND